MVFLRILNEKSLPVLLVLHTYLLNSSRNLSENTTNFKFFIAFMLSTNNNPPFKGCLPLPMFCYSLRVSVQRCSKETTSQCQHPIRLVYIPCSIHIVMNCLLLGSPRLQRRNQVRRVLCEFTCQFSLGFLVWVQAAIFWVLYQNFSACTWYLKNASHIGSSAREKQGEGPKAEDILKWREPMAFLSPALGEAQSLYTAQKQGGIWFLRIPNVSFFSCQILNHTFKYSLRTLPKRLFIFFSWLTYTPFIIWKITSVPSFIFTPPQRCKSLRCLLFLDPLPPGAVWLLFINYQLVL